MRTTVRDFSLSVQTGMPYPRAVSALREAMKRQGFELLCELALNRELERKVGLRSEHCTVLVVWSPFDAYQAVLGDRDGGLLVAFNITLAEHGDTTIIAATNHGALSGNGTPIGIQVMAKNLAKKVRRMFLELAAEENLQERREVPESAVGL